MSATKTRLSDQLEKVTALSDWSWTKVQLGLALYKINSVFLPIYLVKARLRELPIMVEHKPVSIK